MGVSPRPRKKYYFSHKIVPAAGETFLEVLKRTVNLMVPRNFIFPPKNVFPCAPALKNKTSSGEFPANEIDPLPLEITIKKKGNLLIIIKKIKNYKSVNEQPYFYFLIFMTFEFQFLNCKLFGTFV